MRLIEVAHHAQHVRHERRVRLELVKWQDEHFACGPARVLAHAGFLALAARFTVVQDGSDQAGKVDVSLDGDIQGGDNDLGKDGLGRLDTLHHLRPSCSPGTNQLGLESQQAHRDQDVPDDIKPKLGPCHVLAEGLCKLNP
jgi:hypothetical protein